MTNPEEMGVEEQIEAWLETQEGSEAEEVEEQETEVEETEGEESEEEQAEPEEEFAEVEYEGKQYKLPPELKDALLRQSDYTRKTQEVAEMRKQNEAAQMYLQQQAQIQQQFLKEYANIQALDNQLAQYQKVNWQEMIESDPVEAMKLDHQYRQLQQYRDSQAQQLQHAQAQAQQQQQEHLSQQLQQAAEQLQKDIPGWGRDLANALKSTGQEYGFSEGELDQIYDPRMVRVLHDAMQYRKLRSAKPEVQKRVEGKPPVLKPGTKKANPNAEKQNELRAQARKSGRMEDAARAIESML